MYYETLDTVEEMPISPVNATFPHPKVSERYGFISTRDIITEFEKHDFQVSNVTYAKNHKSNPHKGYGQHMVRMRQQYYGDLKDVVAPVVVIINSHDRTKAFRLGMGMDVYACLNGLMTGDMLADTGRLHHSGRNLGARVLEYVSNHSKNVTEKLQVIKDMRTIICDDATIEEMYTSAAPLIHPHIIDEHKLIYANRDSGMARDLWTIFNNIQENAMKGNYKIKNAEGKIRKARPIGNITKNVKLNAKLWELAEEYIK